MLALGSCIGGSGILITGLLALLFQHPNPPRWTRPQIVPMLICLPITAMIGIGLAYTAVGLWQLVNGAGDPLELVVLAGVLIGLVLAWRLFRQRLKVYNAATGGFPAGAYFAVDSALGIEETAPPSPAPRRLAAGLRKIMHRRPAAPSQ